MAANNTEGSVLLTPVRVEKGMEQVALRSALRLQVYCGVRVAGTGWKDGP